MGRWFRPTLAALALAFTAASVSLLSAGVARAVPVEEKGGAGDKKKPEGDTGIEWEVAPPSVVIFLDGKKLGEAGGLKFTKSTPGKHTVKLLNGKDETEMEVSLKKGQTLKFTFAFDEE